jgi:glycosyltransferase involved in cell wall biosynthesis
MKKQPFVSVIMPNYNMALYLPEAINSILKQTYKNFEFIIVDDCSTDDSWKIIKSFKDKRIKAFQNSENLKNNRTRNKGFEKISKNSEYIAIMDSDDVSLPDRLKREVEFLEKYQDYGAVSSNLLIINEESEVYSRREYKLSWNKIRKTMIRSNEIAHPAAMVRTSVMKDLGGYDEHYTRCPDYDLWMRLILKFKIKNLRKPVLKYRISEIQGLNRSFNKSMKFFFEIRFKNIFKKEFFSVYNLCHLLASSVVFILPKRLVLWLVKKVSFKKES